MSNNTGKREKLRRLTALILVILLIVSVCASAIYYFSVSLSASGVMGMTQAEIYEYLKELERQREEEQSKPPEEEKPSDKDDKQEPSDKDNDSEKKDGTDIAPSIDNEADDKLIRVGLMYGSNVTVGFETDSDFGFGVNAVDRLGDLTNELLWELSITKISCTVDANLAKTAMTYSKTSKQSAVVIGGWHAEIGEDLSYDEAVELTFELSDALDDLDVYAIPSYIDGGYRIRAGHFSEKADAKALCEELSDIFPKLDINVAGPTDTAVSVVDPLTDRILFEYDDNDETALGLTPLSDADGERGYLITPAKKIYDGTFMFRRYIADGVDGVSLTDIIPLGEYIKGVLPYEISSSWPLEAQKAFAICVRSFTLASVRHESTYQVDLCNTAHCQVYNGRSKITDVVEQAVDETAGLVMSYGDKIVTAYYSAVSGGVTVGVDDAWGGSARPYLVAVQTPWEIFTNHSYGVWQTEVSPTELCTYLRTTKGYSNLKGKIVDISVDQLAKNSTYVYQITFTDSYGTKVTVKTTDGVRTALSKYVNSANFVVGLGSVVADTTTFTTVSPDKLSTRTDSGDHALGKPEAVRIMSASGETEAPLEGTSVLTATGTLKLGETSSVTEAQTYYAADSSNFIFVGKGWGHGVGLSQIGVRDLAKLGYEATAILKKYFTDIKIRDWRDILD